MSDINSFRIPFSTRLLTAALAGALAGIAAALLDARLATAELGIGVDLALLLLQAAGRCGLAGALLAVLGALAAFGGERLAGLLGAGEARAWLARALGVTVLAAPGCLYVAVRLFQGGLTSRLPARFWLTAAAAIILVVIVFIVSRVTLSLLRRSDSEGRISLPVIAAAVGLVVVAVLAHYADGRFYRRLYLYLHGVLGITTLSSLAVAFRLTLVRLKRAPIGRGRIVVLVGVGVLFAVARLTFNSRQTVKVAAFENTATTANLLQAFTRSNSSAWRGRPSEEIIALRQERERRARMASSGDFPVFPGAHVIIATVDALRADRLGIYGNTARQLSPHIDAWARAKGIVFDRAYCTAPHSSYSISSLHTSRFIHDDVMLKKEITFPTIAGVLAENGYQTIGIYTNGIFFTEGENVAHYKESKFGFQKTVHGAPPPDEVTDRAIAEIDRAVLNGEPPTFLWVHYFNVHEPYKSTRFGTDPKDRYDGEIALVDPEVARLFAHAEKVLTRGVIIVLAADHGEEFKDHGGDYHGSTLYDEQVRVPLIFRTPGGPHRRIETPVSTAGVTSTLLRLVGIPPAPTMIGQDLRPAIFKGDDGAVPEPVFAAVVNQHMVVRWPWKLIYDPTSLRFELYDLSSDPGEKLNLYDKKPALAKELIGEINGWLDDIGKGESEYRTALNLGHMRDPRAVTGLLALLADTNAPSSDRVEAAELLGNLRDYSAVPMLREALDDRDNAVATQAALALGRMDDLSGEDLLQNALFGDEPDLRDRAAMVLGRAGDTIAMPFLIEALGRTDNKTREQATKVLGELRDPGATEALLDALKLYRLRYLTVLTLGKIGDMRAYDALMDRLENDDHSDVREHCVIAFGWMGAKAAVPRLLRLLVEEPSFKSTAETLVRLGAVGRSPLFGTDLAEGLPALRDGWGTCHAKEAIIDGDYLGRTTCDTTGPRADLVFPAAIPGDALLIVRARHLIEGGGLTALLRVDINGRKAHSLELGPRFAEFRVPLDKSLFKSGQGPQRVTLKMSKNGRFEVDHVLVLATDGE